MSNIISNLNAKTRILNTAREFGKNKNYIKQFELTSNITQYINS